MKGHMVQWVSHQYKLRTCMYVCESYVCTCRNTIWIFFLYEQLWKRPWQLVTVGSSNTSLIFQGECFSKKIILAWTIIINYIWRMLDGCVQTKSCEIYYLFIYLGILSNFFNINFFYRGFLYSFLLGFSFHLTKILSYFLLEWFEYIYIYIYVIKNILNFYD